MAAPFVIYQHPPGRYTIVTSQSIVAYGADREAAERALTEAGAPAALLDKPPADAEVFYSTLLSALATTMVAVESDHEAAIETVSREQSDIAGGFAVLRDYLHTLKAEIVANRKMIDLLFSYRQFDQLLATRLEGHRPSDRAAIQTGVWESDLGKKIKKLERALA